MPGLLRLLPSRANDSMSYLCSVNFLDLSDPVSVTYHRNTKGSFLIEHVTNSIDVTETDYFGLKYLDNNKLECWLDPTKTVYSQLKGVTNPVFHFRVKFYPSNPDVVNDDITRYQLYLQVHKDFEDGRLICTLKDALVLSAYIVQSDLGDCEKTKSTTVPFINTTPATPPNSATINFNKPSIFTLNQPSKPTTLSITKLTPTSPSVTTPVTPTATNKNNIPNYVNDARLPESLKDFQADICLLHKKLQGMHPSTCEHHFLKKASSLNSYGIHPYVVADMAGNNMYLTLTPQGMVVFEDNIATTLYKWKDIKKTSMDGKLFFIKSFVRSSDENGNKEKKNLLKGEKEETKTVAYHCATSKACKQLWKNSVAHKLFFTLTSSEEAPKVVHSGGFLSRGSKFRYSGKCLTEMYKRTKDDSKGNRNSPNKRPSTEIDDYATLPKDETRRNVNKDSTGFDNLNASDMSEDPYDGSEDEKSLLNKTATSIVLNYLSSTKNDDTLPRVSIKRSQTTTDSTKTFPKNTTTKDKETNVTNANNSLPTTSPKTPTQPKSFSAHFLTTTRAIASATSRLKKIIIHNTTKKNENKKENKVVYRDRINSDNKEVEPTDTETISKEGDTSKRKSIFEDADLSHGLTPTLSSFFYPFNDASIQSFPIKDSNISSNSPSVNEFSIHSLNKQGFIERSRESEKTTFTNLPTTLNTSTIVTTIQTTHSSHYRNNTIFYPNNSSVTGSEVTPNSDDKNNYYNDTFNFVDPTIERTDRIFKHRDIKKDLKIDSNRNVVFDGNDTGYLSGSDAFNHSFEGRKSNNIKDFFNQKDNDGNSILKTSNLTLKNSEEKIFRDETDLKPILFVDKGSREELLDLLTYDSQLMKIKKNSNEEKINKEKKTNESVYQHTSLYLNNETTSFQGNEDNESISKKNTNKQNLSSLEEHFNDSSNFPSSNLPQVDLSPISISSFSTKGSTVGTPDFYDLEKLDKNDVPSSSNIPESEINNPDVNSIGVLSDDNFHRIKEIRKLLQENKDKIQEIRENIDNEIRNSFVGSSEKIELLYNNALCYEEMSEDEEKDDGVCGEEVNNQGVQSDVEEYEQFQNVCEDVPTIQDFDEKIKDEESEETIFIDRNYKTDAYSKNEKFSSEVSRGVSKAKHIAFSTKHFEWYGENGMSSGGGGVIYTFCGASVGKGEGKYPSDARLVKNTPNHEESLSKEDGGRVEVKEKRKASIGRSISSIEGFYSADNVHHYNPNFDNKNEDKEDVEEFNKCKNVKPIEIYFQTENDDNDETFDPLVSERVVIGGRDGIDVLTNSDEEYFEKDEEFIVSKINDLTKLKANEVQQKIFNDDFTSYNEEFKNNLDKDLVHSNGHSKLENSQDPKQVSFANTSTYVPSSSHLQIDSLSTSIDSEKSITEIDILTFEKFLDECGKSNTNPFCKILTSKPEGSNIKKNFDELNARNVSGTLSASKFSSDLDDLDNRTVVEEFIVPKVSTLLYENTGDNESSRGEILRETLKYSSLLDDVVERASEVNKSKYIPTYTEKVSEPKPENITNETIPIHAAIPENEIKPKTEASKKSNSCLCTLFSSSLVVIALFSVALVLLFESNKDREYFEGFGPIGSFRSSVYDPYRHYVVCSIKNHLPKDFFGVD